VRACVAPLVGLALCGCATAPQGAQVADRLTPAVVYARGVAAIDVRPDLATVTIQFTARGPTPRAAGQDAAERANAIRDALIGVGIPADSMPTAGRWRWWIGTRSQMQVSRDYRDTSYVTTETFTARIRDFALIGPAIDSALATGAQTISDVAFERTETRGPYVEAIELAARHARENAEAMVRASGGQLGRLLDLSTEALSAAPAAGFRLEEVVVTGVQARGAATTVVAPSIRVTATVFARWEVVR